MSGFNERTNLTFLSIMDGEIVRRIQKGDPKIEGEVERKKTKGDLAIVREKRYGTVTGMIKDIKTKEVEGFGKMWSVVIDVEGEDALDIIPCELSMGYTSSAANCFLCCIENVDLTRPVTFQPKENINVVDGKEVKSNSLFLNQDGKAAKWAHTKDNPNGMPPKEEIVFNGKKQWDSTKKMAWMEDMIKTKILPKISVPPIKEIVDNPVQQEEEPSDLPF